jgi:pyruvate,water dikinase
MQRTSDEAYGFLWLPAASNEREQAVGKVNTAADPAASSDDVIWLEAVGRADVAHVGGKNASLGEMIQSLGAEGVAVAPGFATTAAAYWRFLEHNRLAESMGSVLADLDAGRIELAEAGETIQRAFLRADWPEEMA